MTVAMVLNEVSAPVSHLNQMLIGDSGLHLPKPKNSPSAILFRTARTATFFMVSIHRQTTRSTRPGGIAWKAHAPRQLTADVMVNSASWVTSSEVLTAALLAGTGNGA